jgi:bacteriophage N4 adsorption protein B
MVVAVVAAAMRAAFLTEWILPCLEAVQRELFLFSAVWILIGAVDDLCVDMIWIVRFMYRRLTFYRYALPRRVHQLATPDDQGLLAVFVPAWGEAAVIGAMLQNCTRRWNKHAGRYRIFVGCYPNDPDTAAAVATAAQFNTAIRTVLVDHDGPTTKADCLNRLWRALIADEMAEGYTAKAIILHDAEDSVHADELHVFDCLVSKRGAVQLPVIPVRTRYSRWISGHYCDEFAEAHGKNLLVRDALGAPLPLAGVACAIERNLMGRVARMNGGSPFDANSLTEDYEFGIRMGAAGGRTIMARVLDDQGKLVGTRACFPDTLQTSVRQKTRWLTGIALAGWDRLGWDGNFAQKWMLFQDRKSIFATIVVIAAYICLGLTAILAVATAQSTYQSPVLPAEVALLLWLNSVFLLWRLVVRAGFVAVLYGPKEALLSIPRSFISNVIAIMAMRRACTNYVRHCLGAPLTWDKTTHHSMPDKLAPGG